MALGKQGISINFGRGIDQGSDPWQIPIGSFEQLVNSTFDKVGRLQKRNGFPALTQLPDQSSSYLSTYKGSLVALGTDLKSLTNQGWLSKGALNPVGLSTLSLVRNNLNQVQADMAISPNGTICVAYADQIPVGSTTQLVNKYALYESTTGQSVIDPTIVTSTFGTVSTTAKVWTLGNNFVLAFGVTGSNSAVSRLQYFYVNSQSRSVGSVTDISSNFQVGSCAFDGVVANNSLYLSYSPTGSVGVRARYLTNQLVLSSEVTIASGSASIVSVCADQSGSTPVIWTSFYNHGSATGHAVATNQALTTLFSSRQLFISPASTDIANLTSAAIGGTNTVFYERRNFYPYAAPTELNRSDYIVQLTMTQSGIVGTASPTLARSLGLGSKAFLVGSSVFFVGAYQSQYQSGYFLVGSTGAVLGKLGYGNGGGYLPHGLPSVTVQNQNISLPYLFREEVQAVNKDTNVSAGIQTAGIYSQLGINMATWTFGTDRIVSTELGKTLNLNSGYLIDYDGTQLTENNFHVWPENVSCSVSGTVGSMSAQQYFYQATYEWSDNQGNLIRSAPSIPVNMNVTSGSSNMVVVRIPTLRLTNKIKNPVKVVIYRWSAAQQVYYQVTSIDRPVLNSTSATTDHVVFSDSNSDAQILGNNQLYTTGGALENVGGPSFDSMTTWDTRLWGIDSENKDTLWFSKPVIQNVPVEMSDLQTKYVSPTAGAQGPTGPMKAIAPLDDKLIILKKNAIYFINGRGPDITGGQDQYSEPTFITSVVGCDNQKSIVLIPQGLMFQSDKGIWLLGRDLSTQYIGKEVDDFNDIAVVSALTIPGTNQVRFTLENGQTLMYDYFVGQWGTFEGISGVSSTLYQNQHTFINAQGQSYQEREGTFLDGSNPVLMSFKTGWLNLAGLQAFQRAYHMTFLGRYISPHIYRVGIAYDYDSNVQQLATVAPTNYTGPWGSGTSWGSISYWGGGTDVEQWRIGLERQQCQSFQVSFQEYYDQSIGEPAGAGLYLSGMQVTAGVKKTWAQNIAPKNRTS